MDPLALMSVRKFAQRPRVEPDCLPSPVQHPRIHRLVPGGITDQHVHVETGTLPRVCHRSVKSVTVVCWRSVTPVIDRDLRPLSKLLAAGAEVTEALPTVTVVAKLMII